MNGCDFLSSTFIILRVVVAVLFDVSNNAFRRVYTEMFEFLRSLSCDRSELHR